MKYAENVAGRRFEVMSHEIQAGQGFEAIYNCFPVEKTK
jgi:hypothetical protein